MTRPQTETRRNGNNVTRGFEVTAPEPPKEDSNENEGGCGCIGCLTFIVVVLLLLVAIKYLLQTLWT